MLNDLKLTCHGQLMSVTDLLKLKSSKYCEPKESF